MFWKFEGRRWVAPPNGSHRVPGIITKHWEAERVLLGWRQLLPSDTKLMPPGFFRTTSYSNETEESQNGFNVGMTSFIKENTLTGSTLGISALGYPRQILMQVKKTASS